MLLKILRVHGHSMQPKIKDGQKVLISNIPYMFSAPKKDDVVVFKLKNKAFLKRIVKVKDEKYFLEGDNKIDSLDSKKLGAFGRKTIIAKALWY
ncbi:MAG: S26 family signal peptidase [Candidatus Levyibacteriota bacterium]